ncbi:engulfment and cell motility protein 1 [Condylostylus longicornis]|uniref:engulfment and cell motility protein 1 n=1 Tax=Condylostylus longicornis TaxID=2530218 RepID=UPI00244DC397|nr:engulfment and cell motility protein 1 [Condylostylus longicornis]XP_055376541.1 engulfment and cell motility protein 1 [Condylostylus longicornis]
MLRKSATKDAHIVKIAVEFEGQIAQLIKLDQLQPLAGKIQELCNNWNITDPENYALQFGEQANFKYVTEKNRGEIKNGSVLRLHLSPAKITSDILKTLHSQSSNEKIKCLQDLAHLSIDLTFVLEFIKEQGLGIIISMIENPKSDIQILKYSLKSFVELMEHGIVSWEILETTFISRNILIIQNFKDYPLECIECALSNLENIVQNSTITKKYSLIEKDVTLENILRIIELSDSSVAQQNAIALVNALFSKGDETRKKQIANAFSTEHFRSIILKNSINTSNVGTEMAHQLYVLQTLLLGLLESRMRTMMNATDHDSMEKIMDLRRIAFDEFSNDKKFNNLNSNQNQEDISVRRGVLVNFSQYYKKLGFKSDINPAQDFIETPPGVLALDCMIYFAKNYQKLYIKTVHESYTFRSDEHECPFGRTSIELVKLLCDILKIGEPPAEHSNKFHPMFFTHNHPFEELYCKCIVVLNKTWKDMRATPEDFHKVFSVVREQITRTLKTKPANFEEFEKKISELNYQTITALKQQERTSKEECESTAPSIIALKEKISPEILDLIKQQRLNFLTAGSRFSKYTRGTRNKDKFWYARLSSNQKIIHYGDCDEKSVPTIDELANKVAVTDIKQLLVGKECPHMKGRKSVGNLCFSIVFDNMDLATLDFVAPDEKTFSYWTDGINALILQDMCSQEKNQDFKLLLSMEIKLRLLDCEGIDLSNDPPITPEEPENYDFCFEN